MQQYVSSSLNLTGSKMQQGIHGELKFNFLNFRRMHQSAGESTWDVLRAQAQRVVRDAPLLAPSIKACVLDRPTLADGLAHNLAVQLALGIDEKRIFLDILPGLVGEYIIPDLTATYERDAACGSLLDAFLYSKGFHAVSTYRIANRCMSSHGNGNININRDVSLFLQYRASKMLQVDIHPSASIGPGMFIDHATGVVIGETSRIGNNCTMLHQVTLGSIATEKQTNGDRHPKIGDNVFIGAGASILGNITVGNEAKIGAASLVLFLPKGFER